MLAECFPVALVELKLLILDADPRIRPDGLRDKGIAPDYGIAPDDGFPSENRSAGIYRHIVLDGRMALDALELLPAAGGERADGHALIKLDPFPDNGRFPDNDARRVIDEKIASDGRTGRPSRDR